MDLIQQAGKLGYEKHSGFTSKELDEQPIISIYKQIEYFLIQKWLREKHTIHITVIYRNHPVDEVESFTYLIEGIKVVCRRFKTYELALEKGLFEALKLIK